ncbi:MAG: hypothetical protein B7C54_00245 [Acidimicrobiales bacterium mtb01]|nr:sigma-70 family RNA polymerase sigma factor [Actinomycetota bacterium]TEX48701.1 MAG: hypothetical protein B7C54_00245 [Acidimicrobiales bacterium mtb01]
MADDNDEREAALRALISVHGRMVRVVLSRSERNRDDVDDLWSDVFLLAFRRLDELIGLSDGRQRGWFIRTSLYLVANHGRRNISWRRMLDRLATEPLELQLTAEDEIEQAGQEDEQRAVLREVERALQLLRDVDRRVLILDALGHDGPAIGRELGISAGAARKRLMVARLAFRRQFVALTSDPLPGTEADAAQERTAP